MSGDDGISFGEVTYREPQRLRRPDRDVRKACLAYGVPRPGELPIFLDRAPADAIERHALSDTSVELGGILLGKECVDEATGEPFVWVTEAVAAKHYENTQASFTYTHDSWAEITRERDEKFPDLDIVGWYHTHPDFGIFLSGHDLFIQGHFFAQPLQVAYVVDPINGSRGFFQWREGRVEGVGGFSLVAERSERQALARLVNDLEQIPNTEGGGGGLSPRLEAELIAMLTRPQQHHAPASTAQAATTFGMLGVVVGALAVTGMLWLGSLSRSVQDLAAAQREGAAAQEKAAAAQLKGLDVERLAIKEAALDAILKDINAGEPRRVVAAQLAEAAQRQQEARAQLDRLLTEKDALAKLGTDLRKQLDDAKLERNQAQVKLEKLEDEAGSKLAKLEAEVKALRSRAEQQDKLVADTKAGALQRRYDWAWYAAIGGWAAFVATALAAVAFGARQLPNDDAGAARSEPAAPLAGPTVRIE